MSKNLSTGLFYIVAAFLALYFTAPAQAAQDFKVGSCVTAKTKIGKGGMLIPVGVNLLVPAPGQKGGTPLPNGPFIVKGDAFGMVEIEQEGKILGWTDKNGLKLQDTRNCEF